MLIARIGIIVLTKSRITKNLSISEIASLSSFLEKVFSAAQKTFSKNEDSEAINKKGIIPKIIPMRANSKNFNSM